MDLPGIVRPSTEDADHYRQRGWWRERTVVDDFGAAALQYPDKAAVVGFRADSDPGALPDVVTYRQLARFVDQIALGLLRLGVAQGEVVSYQLPNWWQFAALTLACFRIGAVTNPILPILRRREVAHILATTASRVCVAPVSFRGFDHGAMLMTLADELPALAHVVLIGPAQPDAVAFEEAFLSHAVEDLSSLDHLAPAGDDIAQVQFTSGTTGEPKGVLHSHNTLWAGARAVCEPLHLGSDDVVLMASTMAHQTGYLYGCLMPLSAGMKVVYLDTWDGEAMVRIADEEAVTWTMGATPFVLDAVAAQRAHHRPLRSLATFACAGAPIPPHLVDAAAEHLGTRLVSIWGMTENGAVTIVHPEDPPEAAATTDGRPVPWMALRVVDDEDIPVPTGTVGRLQVRGASQCLGYLGASELYRSQLHDGWFDTGDLAYLDDTGALRIAGRVKDLVIRGGENIPVVEVEALLYRHPKVAEVAVIGVPDDRLGERACAVVVAAGDPPTLEELTAHLDQAGMARHFWPEQLVVLDQLPKTASGKIQKFRLRDQLAHEPSP